MKQQAKERARCFLKRKHDQKGEEEGKDGDVAVTADAPFFPSLPRGPWAV
jgi:hypothetical protein